MPSGYSTITSTFGTPANGFGPYERDRSNGSAAAGDGVPIRIGGVPHSKGLGVHAASEVRYVLDKPCRLQATIGVDDEVVLDGTIDSLGVTRLIDYLEKEFHVTIAAQDVTIENFLSATTMAAMVEARQTTGSAP